MPKPLAPLIGVLGMFFVTAMPQVAEAPAAIILSAPAAAQSSPGAATPSQAPKAATGAAATPSAPAATPSAKHSITVKFDYDFTRSAVCSAKTTTKCVQQFNVYDVSGGVPHRVKLFSIPVPPNARGHVQGITGTSPELSFEPGKHFLAVTAQPVSGDESDPAVCTTSVQINP